MERRILITGGAGFIGSHLADELLRAGYKVRALDCLAPQVHGENARRPDYLAADVELIVGRVEDRDVLGKALEGVTAVVHLAAKVGVGQSMYQVADYTTDNNLATAILMEELVERKIDRVVVASSMSIYGEGLYQDSEGTLTEGTERRLEDLRARQWELSGQDGKPLTPVPTSEGKTPALASVYALSKYDQERMCLMVGRAYGIPTVALRFFNVYGPRQALSNPYTGVLAIFAGQLLRGEQPQIFEDGFQQRDFVNVKDIARACRLALEAPEVSGEVFNIGSGRHVTIREVAALIADALGKSDARPRITGKYRVGDIRHCFSDISRAQERLGYKPNVSFEDGLRELAEWLKLQDSVDQSVPSAEAELEKRGLTV